MVVGWDGELIKLMKDSYMVPGLRFDYSLGTVNEDINFEYTNGADVDVGCGAVLMGEYWYFGGEKSGSKRQVSPGFLII